LLKVIVTVPFAEIEFGEKVTVEPAGSPVTAKVVFAL